MNIVEIEEGTFAFPPTKRYLFKPSDDITALEAAYIAHFFSSLPYIQDVLQYNKWNLIQRHFELELA